jgi:hypothetical protein
MRAQKFDKQLVPAGGRPTMQLRGGFLDDAYFKRMHVINEQPTRFPHSVAVG